MICEREGPSNWSPTDWLLVDSKESGGEFRGQGLGSPNGDFKEVFLENLSPLGLCFRTQTLKNIFSGTGACNAQSPRTRAEKRDNNLVKKKYAQSHFFQSSLFVN